MIKIFSKKSGMTFIEVLIVSALIAVVSLSLYHGLNNGLKVWQRSQQLVVEEDILIFFEKLTKDLHNAYRFSTIAFEGVPSRFAFPVIQNSVIESSLNEQSQEYTEQLSKVEYIFDYNKNTLFRRQANYAQALEDQYAQPRAIVKGVSEVVFKYYYMTDTDEIYTESVLETIPSRIEVTVSFSDRGYRRAMRKDIILPIGS